MATARLFLRFTVAGVAQPRGSKTAIRNKQGVQVGSRDSCKGSAQWMSLVAHFANEAMQQHGKRPTTGPVVLKATFFVVRPKLHFGSGKNAAVLKDSAPAYPGTKPDATKLVRAIEDAMTLIVWRDDTQVVSQIIDKRFGAVPRVEIAVYELPATVAELERETQGQGVLV